MHLSPRDKSPAGMAESFRKTLHERAMQEGFDALGVTHPDAIAQAAPRLEAFLQAGFHGTMGWLADTAERRARPLVLWPDVRSIIMLAMNYGPERDPLEALTARSNGAISVYAQGKDYHDIIKSRLKRIAGWLQRETGHDVKVFVDTAPVMEKPLAEAAGLGWQGKHTNLVSRDLGSWFFLGAIFTSAAIAPDVPESDHCGSCRKCLDICPTDAFPAPYRLDARRCIAYLTIEHRGHIPVEFRVPMGNRIFGCDDCLAVCPWNKFARTAREARFYARASTDLPPLADLLRLDEAAFRAAYSGSPVKRTGRNGLVRNALIAAGNSGDERLLGAVIALLGDDAPVVRAMAVWAARRLMGEGGAWQQLRRRHRPGEEDAQVRKEWDEAEP